MNETEKRAEVLIKEMNETNSYEQWEQIVRELLQLKRFPVLESLRALAKFKIDGGMQRQQQRSGMNMGMANGYGGMNMNSGMNMGMQNGMNMNMGGNMGNPQFYAGPNAGNMNQNNMNGNGKQKTMQEMFALAREAAEKAKATRNQVPKSF